MMAEHNEMGKEGEELAAEYLVKQGYTIEARNWRYGHEEIDIIARKDDLLLIVEVKTRRSNYFGQPESFVSFAKQKALIRCANRYIYQHNFEGDTRFAAPKLICEISSSFTDFLHPCVVGFKKASFYKMDISPSSNGLNSYFSVGTLPIVKCNILQWSILNILFLIAPKNILYCSNG